MRSSGHITATWATLLAMLGAPAVAAPAPPSPPPAAPEAPAATADEARALQGEGRWEEAAEAWRQVAGQEPDNGAAWFNLAYCLHAAGRLQEAIEMHKKAATFDDYHAIAMYNLGCAYALVGRLDDAVDALAEAQDAGFALRDRVGSDPDLQSLRGNPDLAALVAREPAGWRAKLHELFGGVKQFLTGPEVQGLWQKVTGAAQGGLQQIRSWLGHARPAPKTQAAQPAPETPETAKPATPSGTEVTLAQARRFQQAGDWPHAIEAYRALLVDQPESPVAWFGLAYCLHMSGDYEQAIEAHKHAASFDEIRGIALYNLACAYAMTGRTDEALEALEASREAGFDISAARDDSDLDSVRDDPRFRKLMREQ